MTAFEDARPRLDRIARLFGGSLEPDEARAEAYCAWVVAVKEEGLKGEEVFRYAAKAVASLGRRARARREKEALSGDELCRLSDVEPLLLELVLSLPPVPGRVLLGALSSGGFLAPPEVRLLRNAASAAGLFS